MAILKLSELVSDLRGLEGGVLFRTSKGHTVASGRPRTRAYRSALQRPRTLAFSLLVARWKQTLTPAQRAAWERFASHPDLSYNVALPRNLTGFNAFMQENLSRARFAIPYLDNAPPVPRIYNPCTPAMSMTGYQYLYVDFSGSPLLSGEYAGLSMTNAFRASQMNPRVWYRQHFLRAGPFSSSITFIISTPYQRTATFAVHVRRFGPYARFSSDHVARILWI